MAMDDAGTQDKSRTASLELESLPVVPQARAGPS